MHLRSSCPYSASTGITAYSAFYLAIALISAHLMPPKISMPRMDEPKFEDLNESVLGMTEQLGLNRNTVVDGVVSGAHNNPTAT